MSSETKWLQDKGYVITYDYRIYMDNYKEKNDRNGMLERGSKARRRDSPR